MSRRLLLLAVALVAVAEAAAAIGPYVIQADRRAGPVRLARSTLPEVTAALRRDGTRLVRRRPSSCLVTWPRIGLTVDFGLIGSDPRDPCKAGAAFVVTATSRSGWRTAVGLRVGDPSLRVRLLYPHAVQHPDLYGRKGFWLVTRHVCREVGGSAYPGLFARLRHGRVSALVLTAGICD